MVLITGASGKVDQTLIKTLVQIDSSYAILQRTEAILNRSDEILITLER